MGPLGTAHTTQSNLERPSLHTGQGHKVSLLHTASGISRHGNVGTDGAHHICGSAQLVCRSLSLLKDVGERACLPGPFSFLFSPGPPLGLNRVENMGFCVYTSMTLKAE